MTMGKERLMQVRVFRIWLSALLCAFLVVGCSLTGTSRAPVEDRGAAVSSGVDPATLPGAENAGKPGYYTVQRGDTVRAIARAHQQSWLDLVEWNSLSDPNRIEVGQVLRVTPPARGAAVATAPTTSPGAAGKSPAPIPAADKGGTNFIWPADGPVLAGFNNDQNKGLEIGGKAGDPIRAAAAGSVVYAGSGLRGYGNLVIIKHNDTFLTAYAHNRKLLVKEDQKVTQGQTIAEMGSSDADRVKLHFELRRSGRPVDPAGYLPAR